MDFKQAFSYRHVAVIGLDGMGNFNRFTPTPCMDRIFANGAVTYDAYSMDPTISAENWGGMLLGAEPAAHGLTNGYISCHPYENDALPSVFRRIRALYPDAYLASVVNWEPINIGIVEDWIGVDKRTADNDAAVTAEVLDCISRKPMFLFVQLDETDGAGHHFGYGTQGHLDKITEIDALVGKMYDAYVEQGIADETLFLCIADHGGQAHSHGGWSETEKYVFLAAAGTDVPHGKIGHAVTKDVAAIVLHALGIEVPPYAEGVFTSQIPDGICRDRTAPYILPAERAHPITRTTTLFDAPEGLGALFGDRVKACLFFDSTLDDETKRCAVAEDGNVKFYSNGVRGATAEFGATGCITLKGLALNDSFSLCFWLLADADLPQQICVLGNKSPEHGLHQEKGFNVLLRNHSVMVQFGCGDDDTDTVTAFPTDGFSGWIHVTLSFDLQRSEVKCSFDFVCRHTDRIEKPYLDSISEGTAFVVGDDSRKRYNKDRGLIFRMDDLLILDGAADDKDLACLRRYYRDATV